MIGDRIKKLRKTLKLNKEEFSSRLGMSTSSVYEWEYNRVEIKESTLLLIEFIYNVNPGWLRKGKGDMFKPIISAELELVLEWMKSLSDKEAIWLRMEMEQKFNLFKTWLGK